ncbi:MAG: sigma-70 family RNA polymerase sigma factor [Bacteroidetes bacterium]|nr:sigma-70 family RNA polymerase sigma factor [Bacteroidota bacterium]MBU1116662.1 sigma-70 family RNA polymerase sigma factor [Bacteroidota bacterium]MBU1797487.1 sigma-70 family RNA polymerase sigma factor [Bacteroidota bacterium]
MTEKRLISKIKNGNSRAYKKLYDENVNSLFRFMMQFSKDKDFVADWVQRAFIKAYNNINSFSGKSKFSTWLFSIAINEMKSDMRKYSSKNILRLDENTENLMAFDQINDFEWKQEMKQLLSDLDENKRLVFILFEIEGYNHNEIAAMLEISVANSRTTLSRTKQILKENWLNNRDGYGKAK